MPSDFDEVEAAIAGYLTRQIEQFRLKIEAEMSQPIGALETNAALLLSDLCYFLSLTEEQHAQVLGRDGLEHITHYLDAKVTIALPSMSLNLQTPVLLDV